MKKILVVDDNRDLIYSVIDGLKTVSQDFEFLESLSGEHALEILKEETVDLVLLDIMMPGMDGWAVATKMKSDPLLKDIPIVFLTAKTDDLSKGMGGLTSEDYIEKPFDIIDLNKRVRKVLHLD